MFSCLLDVACLGRVSHSGRRVLSFSWDKRGSARRSVFGVLSRLALFIGVMRVDYSTVESLLAWLEIVFFVGLQMICVGAVWGSEIYVGCTPRSRLDHGYVRIYCLVCGFVV